MIFGRKKLLAHVAAILYSRADSSDPAMMEASIEEADRLLDTVEKYKKKKPDPKMEKEWQKFMQKKSAHFDPNVDDLSDREV